MVKLITTRNIANPDDVYELLLRSHEKLTKEESDAFNARLILTLFNHIGDMDVIAEAVSLARR